MSKDPGTIQKLKLSWQTCEECIDILVHMARAFGPNRIVAIARGGLIPGTIISHRLGVPLNSIHISAYEGTRLTLEKPKIVEDWKPIYNDPKTLIVDDIMDTGVTFDTLLYRRNGASAGIDFKPTFMTIAKKTGARFVDFNNYVMRVPSDVWIQFPWEVEEE